MKQIIEYKLVNGTAPIEYISDGGYYPHGEYLVGVSQDNCIIPVGLTVYTRETLLTLIKSLPQMYNEFNQVISPESQIERFIEHHSIVF